MGTLYADSLCWATNGTQQRHDFSNTQRKPLTVFYKTSQDLRLFSQKTGKAKSLLGIEDRRHWGIFVTDKEFEPDYLV